ncbi:MAG: PAS domain S-box protein [Phycisphaerales bacterium]|nr:MAG: PAS domain S-box protein [Phycisphaerales bacterium]
MSKRQDALCGSEEICRVLVEGAAEAICVIDADGVFRFMNGTAAEWLGGRPVDYVGKTSWDVFPKEIADRHVAVVRQVIETGEGLVTDSREPLQGEWHCYHTSVQPLRDGRGQVCCALVIACDVTERREAEAALRRREEEYRSLFDRVPVGVYRTTPDGRILQANPALKRMLGYTQADLPQVSVAETYANRDDRRAWRELLEARGVVRDYEVQLRRADGSLIWARDTARVVRDEAGRVLYYEGSLEDITHRKEALEALRASEREKQAILDTPKEHMMLLDRSLTIRWPNRAACESAGLSREALTGRKCYEIWGDGTSVCPDCPVALAMKAGGPREIEKQTSDGRWWYVRGYPLRDETGEVVGAIEMTRDITEWAEAQEELRRKESMLVEAQRIARLGSWDWDVVNDVLRWSSETYKIFGVDEQSFTPTSRGFLAVIHPDDLERVQKAIDRSMYERVPYSVEHRIIRGDGTERIVQEQGRFFFDDDGRATRTVGTVLDITDQRLAQRALHESEAKYRALAENVSDIVYAIDAQGHLTYVSPQIAAYGLCPGEMIGRDFQEFILPQDRERVGMDFERALATGTEFPTELRLRDGEGRTHWLEERGKLLHDETGRIVGVTGILRDITERKRLEAERDWLAQQRQLALDAAEMGWWHYDPATKLARWDNRYKEIFEISGYERLNEEILARLDPDDVPRVRGAVEAALDPTNPQPYAVEYRVNRPDGTVRWVEAHGVAAFEGERDARRATSFVGTVQDITERKRAEEQTKWYQERLQSLAMELSLAEERERRRLAANLHDNLVQHLGLIQIKLSLLRQTPNEVERQAALKEIEELVGRSIASSRSLTLQLSHPVLYDLGFVAGAEWLAEDVQALYGLKVSVKDDGHPKPLEERIRVVLFQCLREVLINASKHAQVDNVRVRIERRHDDSVRVTVRDRGVGFDPAVLDNRSTHGFGLFSIRERLQHLRGHVKVRSAPGKGTTVILTVPLSPTAQVAAEGAS